MTDRGPVPRPQLTVIGVGNTLMGDDGVAPRIIARLAGDSAASADGRIEYLDGGVGGLRLINWIEQANRLLLIDAARLGRPPGSAGLVGLDRLLAGPPASATGAARPDAPPSPGPAGPQFSLHQTDLAGVLRLADQFYRVPPTWLLAIQIESVEQRESLSGALADRLGHLTRLTSRLARRLLTRPQ